MVRKPTTRPALTNAKPDNALDRTEDMPAAKQHAPLSPANKTPLQPLSRKELVFIDQGVDDYPTLIAGVKEGVDIHLIGPTQDGVLQITATLKQQTDISAVHIVSHGNVGYLALGNSVLSTETLTHYQDALFSWRQALDSDADILIYGCNVAKGASGKQFIQHLSSFTGANIAASSNLTGHYKLGGNWQLTHQQGHIKTSLPFETETTQIYPFVLATTEYFSTFINDTHHAPSFTYNEFTYSINDPSYLSSDLREMVHSGDPYLELGGGVGTTTFTIAKTDESEFSLISLTIRDQFNLGATYTVTGWRDGAKVTGDISHTLTGSVSNTNTFFGSLDINFRNIDAIKVSGTDVGFSLEDWTYGAAITNTPPSISISNTNLTYTENTAATQIDANATLSDSDGSADWNGGKLEVQITANNEAADRISISDTDADSTTITTSGTNIMANTVVIGSLSASSGEVTNGTKLTITFDADATDDIVQEVLQSIRYDNTSDNPGTANRTITFTATDTHGATASDTRTVTVTAVNDAPTLTATGSSPTFNQGGTAADLFSSITASTVESNQTLEQLIITVTNVTDGAGANEFLIIDGEDVALFNGSTGTTATLGIGYSVASVVGTATVTLTKTGMSTADVQTLIDGLAYSNTSSSPSSANRVVTITSMQDNGGTTNGGVDTAALSISSTVTVALKPVITNATYDASTGTLVVTGTNIQANGSGADIDVSKLTFTGEGGATYTLTDSADVERVSATQFNVTLSATDQAAVNLILNKNGAVSTDVSTYNLAAADDWNTHVTDGDTADNTGNGITVSNVAVPTITSATYDANSGALTVTGTDFLSRSGATNDIIAAKFSFTGEGGATYTLTDSADVEVTSGTTFTLMLSATDKAAVNQIVNKDGTASTSGTSYNLAAAEDWAAGTDAAVTVADTTGNSVTVSNVAVPSITSATYDASTGTLAVTGNGFLSLAGATNDIVATAFTFTGEGGATYTLTNDTANVEITSGTSFTITLGDTDKAAVDALLNRNGTSAYDATTYNLAAADNWAAGADAAVNVADLTGNSITVSNAASPSITSATYDASTGALVVTGANIQANSSDADIDVSKLTFTGEGGATYTLTDSADVERDSVTQFSVTLSATDQAAVNLILNKDGAVSTDVSTYNLAAADDWNTHVTDGDTADNTGNGITVSNVAVPTITSATYDANSGALTVTGTDFLSRSGATNDIIAAKFSFTGEGGATYTLTDSADVEVTSGTTFTLMLSATDKAAVNQIVNKDGTASTSGTSYNLAAAEDWAAGADADVNITDTTGNGITVSNVPAPTITSATYDASTGTLAVTGNGFLSLAGATNDIVASKFTFTGEGGATYTLTDSANVEITSGTAFTIMLSATDKAAVNQIVNKNGTSSTSGTSYNLAAAEDWAAGADAAVTVADTTGNSVTVSNVAVPTITAATYDANSGALTVTGTDFLSRSGATNDIVATAFTFTGEGGATYTLTDSADVEVTSGTAFTLVLSATDKAAVDALLNRNGTSAYDATTYNLAAADDWAAGADAAVNVADLISNSITVSNAASPSITSATYDASTGALVVTGANIQANSSGADIDVSKLTFTGEGGTTYTLTDSADVERDSATQFSVTLSATDQAAINLILNKNGAVSTDVSTYNLAAADDWNTHVTDGDTADNTGNGVTVSNVAVPTITAASYDANSGALTVTGTDFLSRSGDNNDIVASKFTFTGEGGATYTLTNNTANVEITSGTSFTITLGDTDKAAVDALLNRNGTSAYDATTYNLAAADDWAAGADAAVNVADLISNSITVSNAASPSITSATYNASTGIVIVTGANIQANSSGADIDVSKLTLTGEGGATYTLTDSADVERDSATQFSVTLSATDQVAVNLILNKDGAVSTDVSTYNLAAADDWNTHVTDGDTADNTGNGVTVSNVAVPTITSATYDANSGALTVTGTDFLSRSGATNDIVATAFTFTGEGGTTYTLTDSADVEVTSGTAFTIMLSPTDKAAVNQIVNKNGTSSTSGTTYNLAAAEDWAAGADAAIVVADTTGNAITVSNVPAPTITSATYDASTGVLVVTGENFVKASGAANDIDVSKLAIVGEEGEVEYLNNTTDVEITSSTSFTVTLSDTDRAIVNQDLINKNGTTSTGGDSYWLWAIEDWAIGADSTIVVADTTGNSITASNVAVPTITSAAYDASTGELIVTGTGFLSYRGAPNDIIATAFTFTGEGGATYTLTNNTANVEITSGTSFTITLGDTDKAAVDALLNRNGTSAYDATTYNLAAADDWAAGADAAVNVADLTGNSITVSNAASPSITSATYDASTGALVVTGANIQANSSGADIDVSKLTFTGEGGATYTLTDSADVERDSATQFSVTLSATDQAAVNLILNKNGAVSTDVSTYNLAAADDWNTHVTDGDTADNTGNGVTVSNVAVPTITSATYDANSGALTVTGTGFLSRSGATNDIVASKFTFTGEGGETYTLTDSANVEITSGTAFTIMLSATDKAVVNQITNKNGTSSTGGTTYNLAAAEDWAAGADAAVTVADTTGNSVTVSNVPAPTITSANYDASTGTLAVTGNGFLSLAGATNDIVTSKFTFTGEGGETYTLTDSANVEITSGTAFTIMLSATDKAAVNQIVNKDGTASTSGTSYNLAAAEDWAAGADAAVVVADTTGNSVTVSNVAVPTITAASYDANSGALTVTGTGFLSRSGATNDIIATNFSFTGEGGATYTLTDSANVEITSGTAFTLMLSATDKAAINQIVNKNGTSSTSGTTYNLAAAEDWAAGADAAVVVADTTGNSVTVSNVAVPTITSATYDASIGTLAVTGNGFLSLAGATNDIVASKFTFTGEGGETYTLTDSANVEITSGTAFTLMLSATDKAAVNQIINKDGTASTSGTTYNLAAAEDWAVGADAAVTVADTTSNSVTVSNVAVPTITSANYDASTGTLAVTGNGFLSLAGATNDIVATAFTFTGEGGATYTLTNDTANVEITSGTSFTITLGDTDKAAVDALLNRNGTSAYDATTYNLAAADNWAAGADAAVNVADLTGNSITVSNAASPSITSATYDASTGALVVTGANIQANSSGADIDVSKLTFTGEGGTTYTLTDSADVERDSATQFSVTLSATDQVAVNLILNKDGAVSTDVSTYNLAAADDWNTHVTDGDTADNTGNGITVSNVAVPTITAASYDANSGALTVTGTDFLSRSGATNDIVATAFTFTGEGGTTYTLTDSADVEVTSGTAFTIMLSPTDKAAVNQIVNKNGTSSTSGTTYNLAAAEDWAAGADAAIVVADTTGNAITVSNVPAPTITSATYDASTGVLVVTGENFVKASGAANDIDVSKLAIVGEEGEVEYLNNTTDVEITSSTSFTVTLSDTDRAIVNQDLINKNGTTSTGGDSYWLWAIEDWAIGADSTIVVADTTGNSITASNVAVPTITSAAYDASTGELIVTGTGFLSYRGAPNDIIATAFTFTGEGGATYTLTNNTANVEITSGTSFTITLGDTDKAAVDALLNRNGTSAYDATTYNLAAADDWAAGADAAVNVADLTGNSITVSNAASPSITSATYDASTGALVVTGANIQANSSDADIDVSKLTFTGEGGTTYTLTDSADVERDSVTQFSVTLSATDQAAVNLILNKDGAVSTDVSTYNLAAADDWNTHVTDGDTADNTGNGITVSNVAVPTITAASYDANSGALTVTGTDFLSRSGATNDIVATAFTFTGEGGATYTLTDSADVEITSGTAFTLMLSATDKAAVDALLNRNGTSAYDATTYNLAAADDWAAGADAAVNVADLISNSITVSNAATPSITSATYNASTGIVIVTGANIQANSSGADIDVSKLTFTGEGGATYTLTDSADVERDSATQFNVTLSATDKAAVNLILNKNGTASTDISTYNLAAADDWNTHVTDGDTADTTGNGVTVSNVAVPTITSATYDANSGALTVTGTDFLSRSGATNDIVATAFTFTGEGGATYTLTDSADVEVTSGTAFTLMLSATDKAAVNQITNKNGTSSTSGTTYNLAAAEDWAAGADADVNITDTTGNGITVSNVPAPTITSATYDASTGTLAVTGNGFLSLAGATNDIVASKFTFTGEGGATYTLTDSANVEITSGTAFTIMLSATDKAAVNQIVNKDGTASTSGTSYNLAAAEDWAAGADAAVTVADTTGNSVTVSDVAVPTITAASYDANSGALTVTGTGFLSRSGATNDIVASKFTFTGEGGETYTLTDSADVEITPGTAFTIMLSATDKAAINQIVNKNGTSSTSGTTYNLAAAEDWAAGADAAVVVADTTSNSVTVSNVAVPTITSANYDASTGTLAVTGNGFLSLAGATNDIVASKFTFTGEGGETYTLTDSANVEITSGTAFTITLSATDKAAVNQITNKNGTTSTSGTTYNLAAAEDWAVGADAAVTVADTTGNSVTVSNVAVPTITAASYDANSGALTVTGTDFLSRSGATNDIVATAFTFTGEGGATYTLTDSADVEITSGTAFTLMLSATDKAAVDALLNRNGTSAYDATTYNLAAADDWAAGADAAVNVADLISNSITVSNAASPSITSATYNASTGIVIVTGANIQANSSGADIDVSKLTFTGEGGATYTLTDSADVERDSATQFSVTLSATDQAAVNLILNKDGAVSTDVSTYNLAAADDWNTHVTDGDTADNTGNGVTVSNVAVPTITSATYDANSGALTVTGTDFLSRSGDNNDIVASKFTFTGDGGATYTLTDSADVEVTSGTAFTLMLSATDKAAVDALLNRNGTSAYDATTYNLAAADDWAAGADAAVNVADLISNSITVSNAASPSITSATYNASTGIVIVTGANIQANSSGADIDVSKLTLTGEGGATYTLTDSVDVERDSATQFSVTLSATDQAAVNLILNKDGAVSTDVSTYNLAAADDWNTHVTDGDTADNTGNGVTVSDVAVPTITAASYDANSGALTVTGTGFLSRSGATNDIIATNFSFTGEGGATYTLTDSADVEITSGTAFTLMLSATDKAAINQIVNKNGTSSTSGTTYNLAAAEDWAAGADAAVTVADTTGNSVTVSNVAVPTITSATYDASIGTLAVTGNGFLSLAGATNDIVASKFTFTGEGGETYTLTDSANVEITSGTAFTITLSATDKAVVNQITNKNGTSSTGGTTYNLAAAEDWAAGADAAVTVADTTGNSVTVSDVAVPTITAASYDANSGALTVTGTGFLSRSGATNDIIATNFSFTGEGGATYTLTDSANVEITSGTAFTLMLSATDKAAINQIVNKNGTSSTSGTSYNLAAAEDWAAGADAAVTVADTTGNSVTVSNVAVPTITAATYDANSGALTVTGTDFLRRSGDHNDVVASKFTFTGEGGATYTLTDSADVEVTSGTAFTLVLSATDKAAVDALLNRNGTSAYDATTYNLAAADNWAAGADAAVNVADLISNSITVSNAASPSITSATYNASTGIVIVTGANIQANSSGADIDVSKLTLTGEGGATYTLTDSADVERDSATQFSVTLSATDQAAINLILNKNGAVSTDVSTYNLAAADDWNTHVTDGDTADNTGNGVTVSNVAVPTITAASYDANSGALTVTGTDFLSRSGATNDIIAAKFSFTGEGGATYTLTDSADVEVTSGTAFTIMLSATDKAAVNQITNRNGTSSTSGTTYNLAAAEDWAAGADAAIVVADTTGNGITVSNVPAPTITSATYDANSGALTVTGTGFLSRSGAINDIVASKFTFTGEGGETYTLTDSANVEITSGTAFTITLSATDKAAVNQITNKNGTASTSGTTYNLAAAEDWAVGADAAVTVADTTGNGIIVSNVPAPTITSAAYDYTTGVLVVTGENFVKAGGAANDIDVSKFTFTGQGGATYTLTDSTDVEITSDTSFTVTLSATDKAAVNQRLNKNGTNSNDATPYNLAADEDWVVGADASVDVVDLTGNSITVSNVPAPSSGNGTPPPVNTPVDGIDVSTISQPDGSVLITAPIVTGTRQDDPTSLHTDYADIPILNDTQGDALLTVSLPVGVGLRASGQPQAQSGEQAINELMQRIAQKTTEGSEERQAISNNGQSFLDALPPGEAINVQTIELTTGGNPTPDVPILITGSDAHTQNKQVLVIDARDLPAGTILQLDNVAFAVIIGAVRTVGGKGQNFVTASGQDQIIILGEDDDILFGGDGSDTVGSLGGSDQVSGDAGDDIVYGGTANDILNGGSGNDQLNGGLGYDIALQEGQLSDYRIDIHGHEVVLTHTNGETDTLTDIEQIHFASGPSLAIAHSEVEAAAHHLAKNWLNRDLTVTEGQAVQDWHGATLDDIIVAFHALPEASGLSDQTSNTLLAGLGENPHILRLDVEREFIGSVDDDQGYLPLGLALHADGDTGHDVLQMQGSRTDVHLEFNGNALELTRLSDGAMLSLQNAEAIAFDSGDTVILAHNVTEGILGRLFHTFLGRDATSAEWQLGREALASEVDPDIILDWFQQRAGLDALSNSDYIQTIFSQSFGRQATEAELNAQLLRLENNQISREWLAVEVAQTTEAEIHLVGSVMLQEGWV